MKQKLYKKYLKNLNAIQNKMKLIKFFFVFMIFLKSSQTFSQWNLSANTDGGIVNVIISEGGSLFAGTSTEGIFRSTNNGANWIQTNSGLGNSLYIQAMTSKPNYIFTGTTGGFFYSTNGGDNWIISNQGISQTNIRALITDDSGYVYAGCIFAGVFRSTNNGLSWYRFALGEGDLLFALSKRQNFFLIGLEGGIYKSTNYGYNWSTFTNGLTDLSIRKIVHSDNNFYCATFDGGVFVTENNVTSWQPMNSGLSNLRVQALYYYGNNLFTAIENKGIYHFKNSTGQWVQINEGLTDSNFHSLCIKDEFIYAGSRSGKIWKRPVAEIITGIESAQEIFSNDFVLYQNYPNPFNPSTTIRYKLNKKSFVSIKVYGIQGNEILSLVNESKVPGTYSLTFDGKDLSAGNYFVRISAGDFRDTKVMTMVK